MSHVLCVTGDRSVNLVLKVCSGVTLACRGVTLVCRGVTLACRGVMLACRGWHWGAPLGGVGVRWDGTLVVPLMMPCVERCHRVQAGASLDWWHPKHREGCAIPPLQPHLHMGGLTGSAPTGGSPGHSEIPFLFDILRNRCQACPRSSSFCSQVPRESWAVLGCHLSGWCFSPPGWAAVEPPWQRVPLCSVHGGCV